MTDEKLIEEIAQEGVNLYAFPNLWKRLNEKEKNNWRNWAKTKILTITDAYYKEKYKNYVKLAADQSLPANPFTSRYMMDARYTDGFLHEGYEKAQQDLLKAIWRKVEVEDEG